GQAGLANVLQDAARGRRSGVLALSVGAFAFWRSVVTRPVSGVECPLKCNRFRHRKRKITHSGNVQYATTRTIDTAARRLLWILERNTCFLLMTCFIRHRVCCRFALLLVLTPWQQVGDALVTNRVTRQWRLQTFQDAHVV